MHCFYFSSLSESFMFKQKRMSLRNVKYSSSNLQNDCTCVRLLRCKNSIIRNENLLVIRSSPAIVVLSFTFKLKGQCLTFHASDL